MVLLSGVLFIKGVTGPPAIYLMATLIGNSVLVDLYMFATSMRMCVWYKLNYRIFLIVILSIGRFPSCLRCGNAQKVHKWLASYCRPLLFLWNIFGIFAVINQKYINNVLRKENDVWIQ